MKKKQNNSGIICRTVDYKSVLAEDYTGKFIDIFIAGYRNIENKISSEIPLGNVDRKRYESYRFKKDKLKFLQRRIKLFDYLEKILTSVPDKFNLKYSQFGKPGTENLSVHFNISESRDVFVIGVFRENEIGVDIEKIEVKNIIENKSLIFSEREIKFIGNSMDAYYKLWTRKEAFWKLLGYGITGDFKKYDFTDGFNAVPERSTFSGIYYITSVLLPEGYYLSVASESAENIKLIYGY